MIIRDPSPGPFFVFSDGTYLTRERFVEAVQKALDLASIDSSSYAGHSFRIGAATTATKQGIQDSLVKTLGCWKSSAYSLYICIPRGSLCSVARTLVGAS